MLLHRGEADRIPPAELADGALTVEGLRDDVRAVLDRCARRTTGRSASRARAFLQPFGCRLLLPPTMSIRPRQPCSPGGCPWSPRPIPRTTTLRRRSGTGTDPRGRRGATRRRVQPAGSGDRPRCERRQALQPLPRRRRSHPSPSTSASRDRSSASHRPSSKPTDARWRTATSARSWATPTCPAPTRKAGSSSRCVRLAGGRSTTTKLS